MTRRMTRHTINKRHHAGAAVTRVSAHTFGRSLQTAPVLQPLLFVLVTLLLLSGCQSRAPLPTADMASQQVREVPFFPQEDYQCGPAALATVLGHAGVDANADALVDEVWLPERQGSLAMELVAAARARGLLVYPVNDTEALFSALEADIPVLVMQNLALKRWPQWHFAVVTGYRDDGRTLILNTDTREAEPERWNRFIRTWARAEYQGWVLSPHGTLPAWATPLAAVQALEELTGTAGPPAARAYWEAAAERWPDHYLVQFGTGNHRWQTDDTHGALTAWRKATDARPQAFAPWHNLALAYAQMGCPTASEEAARMAADSDASAEQLDALRSRLAATRPEREDGALCP